MVSEFKTLTPDQRAAIAQHPIIFAVACVRAFFSGLFLALRGKDR